MQSPARKTLGNNGRYAKLFGFAKELGIDKGTLSAGAAEWTGRPSLRSLSRMQLREYEENLRQKIQHAWRLRRAAIDVNFQCHATLSSEQFSYLCDLIASIFISIDKFRSWLDNFFSLSSERFIDSKQAQKVIKALSNMRNRGYSTVQGNHE